LISLDNRAIDAAIARAGGAPISKRPHFIALFSSSFALDNFGGWEASASGEVVSDRRFAMYSADIDKKFCCNFTLNSRLRKEQIMPSGV